MQTIRARINQVGKETEIRIKHVTVNSVEFRFSGPQRSSATSAIAGQNQQLVPDLCPGCRHLLPQGKRERGLVKWYNGRKRYGFIVRKGQPEIFVHGSDVEEHSRLRPGALVEFTVSETERGAAAKSVQYFGTIPPRIATKS